MKQLELKLKEKWMIDLGRNIEMINEDKKELVECPRCKGTGEVEYPKHQISGIKSRWVICGFCNGRGKVTKKERGRYDG